MKIIKIRIVIITLILISLSSCYTEGNSFFLGKGEVEYFLSMKACEKEATAKWTDGKSKYSGYECRSKFLIFTLEKKEFYEGKITR